MLAPYRERHPSVAVHLHCAPIEDAPVEGPYDLIVCGLPFNNFPPKLMRSIFRRMFELLKPEGELVYFEYAGVRAMKAPVLDRAGRARMRRIDAIGKSLRRQHDGRSELVLANFPPAFAYHLAGAKTPSTRARSGSQRKAARVKGRA